MGGNEVCLAVCREKEQMSLGLERLTERQAVTIAYQLTVVTDAAPAAPASSPSA
jgi:hypothetical protein